MHALFQSAGKRRKCYDDATRVAYKNTKAEKQCLSGKYLFLGCAVKYEIKSYPLEISILWQCK